MAAAARSRRAKAGATAGRCDVLCPWLLAAAQAAAILFFGQATRIRNRAATGLNKEPGISEQPRPRHSLLSARASAVVVHVRAWRW